MIILLLKIIDWTFLVLQPIMFGAMIGSLWRRMKTSEQKLERANSDIKTLHTNQKTLVSSLRDLQRTLRRYDKDLKRKVRIDAGTEEARQEEIRDANS